MAQAQVPNVLPVNYIQKGRLAATGSNLDTDAFLSQLLSSRAKMEAYALTKLGFSQRKIDKMSANDLQYACRSNLEAGGDHIISGNTLSASAASGNGAFVGQVWFKTSTVTQVWVWDGNSWVSLGTGA